MKTKQNKTTKSKEKKLKAKTAQRAGHELSFEEKNARVQQARTEK